MAVSLDDDAVDGGAGVLAQMTGLRRLHLLESPSPIPDEALLQLTRLHQLTELRLPEDNAEVRAGT